MTEQGDHRGVRREYEAGRLSRQGLPADPLLLFGHWLAEAVDTGAADATAMTLATASADGLPSARIVLLKEHGPDGFVWFTDYGSQKGHELGENPRAALVFYWGQFSRQVRVSGPVTRVDEQVSREYFESRPVESRFSAAASDQSQPVSGRGMLEDRVAQLKQEHPDDQVPMPDGWGGYSLDPLVIEFWQGREGRLHDRFRYSREGGAWSITRLQP